MLKNTITHAVIQSFEILQKPANLKSIHSTIVENDLYNFNTQSPINVLSVQVRRHCVGLDFPTAKEPKYFQILSDGTYWLANKPIPGITKKEEKENDERKQIDNSFHELLSTIKENHQKHISLFKKQIINRLKEMPPQSFEEFSKKLLVAYGFIKMEVTNYVKDGGIDGYGQLKVGMTHLNVAFQSKRWKNNSVSRTEIDKFRGAIQGEYEQGIIFTTSKFTKEALSATRKPGAVPIILIDGESLVDIMIEKRFGIEIENLPIYINALDNVLND
jgi:restriction system protein